MLVHSPLVGPTTWEAVACELRRRGHEVLVPELTGSLTGGPPYFPKQVHTITRSAAGRQVVLVGHSGAGSLLAPAGVALGGVAGYMFVDAGLPSPGQSWLQTARAELGEQLRTMATDGWLPPWPSWWGEDGLADLLRDPAVRERFASDCSRLPVAMFAELEPPAPGWPDAPCAYLRLSEAYSEPAERAKVLGWPVTDLASHHLAMLSDPGQVADSLLDLVRQLRRDAQPGAR